MPPVETTPTRPAIETARTPRTIAELLPPYQVVLHNDDVNTMDHVVRALMRSVPRIGLFKATTIMMEAHSTGRSRVTVCPKELAELYQERLQTYQLTVTIEPA